MAVVVYQCFTHSLTHSYSPKCQLIHALTHSPAHMSSLPHLRFFALTHKHTLHLYTHSLPNSSMYSITYSHVCSLISLLINLLLHPLIHRHPPGTHTLTHSLLNSFMYSVTHSHGHKHSLLHSRRCNTLQYTFPPPICVFSHRCILPSVKYIHNYKINHY